MSRRFVRLSDLDDHRVAKKHHDPRGWDVITRDEQRLGKVAELIVDRDALRARYLDVRVDEKGLDMEPVDRHILVPVDQVRFRDKKKVEVDRLTPGDLQRYPVYTGLPLEREKEEELRGWFASGDEGSRERSGTSRDRSGGERSGTAGTRATEARAREAGTTDRPRTGSGSASGDETRRPVDDPRQRTERSDARERKVGEGSGAAGEAGRGRGATTGERVGDQDREPQPEKAGPRPTGEKRSAGEQSTTVGEGEEVRVRVREGEIVIEKGGRDHG